MPGVEPWWVKAAVLATCLQGSIILIFQKLMELHPYFAYFQKVIGGPTLSSLIRVALHVAYCLSFTFASL